MLMHASAQEGTDTVRDSALKVDSGSKILWRTGEWDLRQRRVGPTLRTQNSELYYSKVEILGICLFLQSIFANLHANTYTKTVSTLTTMIQ